MSRSFNRDMARHSERSEEPSYLEQVLRLHGMINLQSQFAVETVIALD